MDMDVLINEKIQRLQNLNKEMAKIATDVGALQEKGRALHGLALQVKGAIEALSEAKTAQEDELKKSETAKLILPEGVKPILPDAPAPAAETTPTVTEAPKAPTLEVVQ